MNKRFNSLQTFAANYGDILLKKSNKQFELQNFNLSIDLFNKAEKLFSVAFKE